MDCYIAYWIYVTISIIIYESNEGTGLDVTKNKYPRFDMANLVYVCFHKIYLITQKSVTKHI